MSRDLLKPRRKILRLRGISAGQEDKVEKLNSSRKERKVRKVFFDY